MNSYFCLGQEGLVITPHTSSCLKQYKFISWPGYIHIMGWLVFPPSRTQADRADTSCVIAIAVARKRKKKKRDSILNAH